MKIELSKEKFNVTDIEIFLRKNDNEFVPPIGERRDLREYAEKVYNEASIIFLIREDNSIGGLSIIYADPNNFDYAFWTYLLVEKDLRKINGGKLLVKSTINFVRKKGMKGINTRTWESNKATIIMHLFNGFTITGKEYNRNNNERSVNLNLKF